MQSPDRMEIDPGGTPSPLLRTWVAVASALTVVGILAFLYGISSPLAPRAWQVFAVNYIFWAGLCFGAVLFSAVLNLSKAVWGRPLKRLAESFGAYLPVSFLLFWVFWPGREHIFTWIKKPVVEKAAFLNVSFMFAREGAGILVLTVLSLLLVYYSVKADRKWLAEGSPAVRTTYPWSGLFLSQWRLSPVLPIAYAFILSLFAIDLIMSLDPWWYSTLFPGYYFVASFYSAIVCLYLFALVGGNRLGLKKYLLPRQFHDLGKLTLGFCIFTGYLFYGQLLVIWYGNLPEETRFVILRTKLAPWASLGWTVLFLCFVIPFFTLLSKKIKVNRPFMVLLTMLILLGLWLERFILVVPSIWHGPGIPLGLLEMLVSAGFFGLVWLCVTIFLSRVPVVPVSDPLFHRFLAQGRGSLKP